VSLSSRLKAITLLADDSFHVAAWRLSAGPRGAVREDRTIIHHIRPMTVRPRTPLRKCHRRTRPLNHVRRYDSSPAATDSNSRVHVKLRENLCTRPMPLLWPGRRITMAIAKGQDGWTLGLDLFSANIRKKCMLLNTSHLLTYSKDLCRFHNTR